MRNAAAPSVGGDSSAPMPAADRIAPPVSGAVARAPQQRPRHRSEHHRRRDAAARHGAEQESGERDRPAGPGARARAPHRRHRPVDEERAGAGVLEHRAVDREQDDVGRGDVERHAEDALERHVERADQPLDAVAAVREQRQADPIELRARRTRRRGTRRPSPAGSIRPRAASPRARAGSRARRARDRSASDRPRDR